MHALHARFMRHILETVSEIYGLNYNRTIKLSLFTTVLLTLEQYFNPKIVS